MMPDKDRPKIKIKLNTVDGLVEIAAGKTGGPGKVFLPVFLVVTFGVVIVYMTQSLNNRGNS